MTFIQNSYCATYGPDDNLLADVDTIWQYAGKSALSAIDTLDIVFARNTLWKPNRTGREFIASFTVRDQQSKKELAFSCCLPSR